MCFILLGLSARVQAQAPEQTLSVTIKWEGYSTLEVAGGAKRRVPTFQGVSYSRNSVIGSYQLRLAGTVGEGRIQNAVYAAFEAADGRLFKASEVPTTVVPQLQTATELHQPVSFVTIQPLRLNAQTGQAEKLISFDYVYSFTSAARRGNGRTYAAASVLRQGDWYKIGVAAGEETKTNGRSGIYKLRKSDLTALGLSASFDPRLLRIYGNAMGLLPQPNSTARPDDLVENAIFVSSGQNSSFGDNDYVLFYARGPHTWERDGTNQRFRHIQNIYADTAYYFVTASTIANAGSPRRVAAKATPGGTPSATITNFTERQFYEREYVNLLRSGRRWLGEVFDNGTQQNFTFSVPDLEPNSQLQVTSVVAAKSAPQTLTFFQVKYGEQVLSNAQTVSGSYDPTYLDAANDNSATYTTTLGASPGADIRINLAYNASSAPTSKGYLDYLEINALRKLQLSGNFLDFRSFSNIRAGALSEFRLSNAAGVTVWEVTNPRRPVAQSLNLSGSTGSFVAVTDSLREFVAFTGTDFPAPRSFGKVPNQDLHARLNLDGKLDLVIICYPPFKEAAESLAAHRRSHDNLNVAVVTTTEVYNEFGSGGQDVTAIRDMMKMVYDRTEPGKRNFLLLFGDASFDYKSDPTNAKDKLPTWWSSRSPFSNSTKADEINQNYVPIYESRESFVQIFAYGKPTGNSYSSDDYFGLLDDDEGEWNEVYGTFETLDIGIGRLPVRATANDPRSAAMAWDVVNKLKAYDSKNAYGKWRNRITFVADDGDNNEHVMTSTEPFANALLTTSPSYNVHKVYLDMYPQASQRSPRANVAIEEAIDQGSLIINYNGHGGPLAWAEEQILTKATVPRLQNADRLSFFLTATCDFSTYDNPEFDSAGEDFLTHPTTGAIGLLTTARLALLGENVKINQAFYTHLFDQVGGQLPRLGDIVAKTKNDSDAGTVNRNFALLGDPTSRLAYPQQEVVMTTINGKPVGAGQTDTLKSLSKVELRGEVRNNGAINRNFTGTAQITIFEKPSVIRTLGNESAALDITVQENIVYAGQASVRNGEFNVSFIVPKDINYSLGLGKISLYAFDPGSMTDANGSAPVPVGGAQELVARDSLAPRIRLFMDTESFVFGGLTKPNTTLLAQLRDENGINTASSGVGHEITSTLDNDPSTLKVLNDFYTAEVDSFQVGRVTYPFKDLATGPHVLRLKAWDTYNNSAEKEIEFIVASNEKLALNHVLNYPNPFSSTTTFHFDHNRSGEDLDVQVQIFTVSGKLVRTLRTTALGSGSHLALLSWDGRDEYSDQLARGVYVYRVSVRAASDNAVASKYEKLVILN